MTLIRIKTGEYYNRPEFYPYMPESIFNAKPPNYFEGKGRF